MLAIFSNETRVHPKGRKLKRASRSAPDGIDNISSSSSSSSNILSESDNEYKTTQLRTYQNTMLHNEKDDDQELGSDDDGSSMASEFSLDSHFQRGNETDRRQFENSILLYSTEVMDRYATNTIQEMTETMEQQGEVKQSLPLALACDRHTKVIIDNVRRRLREGGLPSFYASIAQGDTCKEGMDRINKERMLSVKKTAILSSKLVEQNGQLQKRLKIETGKRDQLKEEEEWIRRMARKKVHPLLSNYFQRSEKTTDAAKCKKPQKLSLDYIPAPPGTMMKLLEKITNHYS